MPKLILLRHGESQWNLENRFTGWVDVELSPKGEAEAKRAGELIAGIPIDKVYTSVLKRAINTANIALGESSRTDLPTERDQALNERHYGDLQGLNKAETALQYGDEQVHIWRRSYDVPPPNGESLKDTAARTIPYFESRILPDLKAGKNSATDPQEAAFADAGSAGQATAGCDMNMGLDRAIVLHNGSGIDDDVFPHLGIGIYYGAC